MDIDKLIAALEEAGILREVQTKRVTTTELPATLYVKLLLASAATKKTLTSILSTALETYCMRNAEKHLDEIRVQAAAAGKELEQYAAEIVASKSKSKESES